MTATHFKILVRPDKIEDTIKMKGPGGISVELVRPQQNVEKEQAAAVTGVIVDMSPLAHKYEVWPEGARKPEVGDRVAYAKYAGQKLTGKDGQDYLFLMDIDLCGILDF